jgi:SAM-dependent methyltransferase
MMDNFINVRFKKNKLDIYLARKSIFEFIKHQIPYFRGDLLDVGCGKMPYRQYIFENSKIRKYDGLDIEGALLYDEAIKPDYYWDGQDMPFENQSYDCILLTEVLEHCPYPDILLRECFRVLRPDGMIFLTVPFLWNLHEVPHDEYRYTPFSLERHLRDTGFKNIEIKASGGWHLAMAQMLGLWVRRAPMNNTLRNLLSYLLMPVMGTLMRIGGKEEIFFRDGQMITGLNGSAKKN